MSIYNITNLTIQNDPATQMAVINAWTDGALGMVLWIGLTILIFISLQFRAVIETERVVGITMVFMAAIGILLSIIGILPVEFVVVPVIFSFILIGVMLWRNSAG